MTHVRRGAAEKKRRQESAKVRRQERNELVASKTIGELHEHDDAVRAEYELTHG